MEYRENGNKIKIINATKFPDVLVVTPLKLHDWISKETKKTIKRNKLKYFWISSEGNNNIPTNAQHGINWAWKNLKGRMPKYYIMIDRDIVLGRSMLDRLFKTLEENVKIGYAYAGFEFKGAVNQKFPADPFDPERLMQGNYISSNSMFKMSVINEVGLVTDDKYKRLLDWAFLLKCLSKGYYGINVPNARFLAISEPGDISAGGQQDYWLKHQRVYEDFVKPLVN